MHSIPIYPNTCKLSPDISQFIPLTQQLSPFCSDFSFANLITWDVTNTGRVSLLEENYVIKIPAYNYSAESQLILLGCNNLGSTIHTLSKNETIAYVSLVPELYIQLLTKQDKPYRWENIRDDWDYLYSLEELVKLKGSGYRHFRRGLSNFVSRNNTEMFYVHDHILKPRDITDIQDIVKDWGIATYGTSDYEEGVAIAKALELYQTLNMKFATVSDGNKVVGFIIYECLSDNKSVLVHFEKNSREYQSLSYFMKYEFYKAALEHNFTILNYEQDLGIPGLRQSKLSLQPSGYNQKFKIFLN
jgi:uncharacterized protein